MLQTGMQLNPRVGDGDFSFRNPDRMVGPYDAPITYILIGDEERGPLVVCMALPGGPHNIQGGPHAHACDTFRTSLLGVLTVGPERYGPGEFRFQQGWKPYGADSVAAGPDGGWTVLMFADRRGVRTRSLQGRESPTPFETVLSKWMDLKSDYWGDEGVNLPGSSYLTTSAGQLTKFHRDGSFADSSGWLETESGARLIVALLGDAERGPVIVLADSPVGAATGSATFGTEVMRIVSEGDCYDGVTALERGDARIDLPDILIPSMIAGPSGVRELIFFGDRRGVLGATSTEGWFREVPSIIERMIPLAALE
jgi:hypothetical protein